jgi:nucleoside-diphosphate-sugar epimerase
VGARTRVLVIGGTGFIGPPLVEQLAAAGHEVAAFHRGQGPAILPAGVRRIVGDRRRLPEHRRALLEFGPEVVVDVILSSGAQARELMAAFRGSARRVIALSSVDVYRACGVLQGLEAGPLEPVPLTEDSPLRAGRQTYPPEQIKMLQTVFGWLDDEYDKIPVERAILGDPELPGTVLRLPMVYGPRDPLRRLLPVVKRIDDGRPAIVLSESMAQWRGPRGYVDNVAAAAALAVISERAAGRVYNVGDKESFSELEWTRRVADVLGWGGEVVVVPDDRAPAHLKAPGNAAQHWTVDTARIRRELGFRERVAVNEAILRTAAWLRTNPPADTAPHVFDYPAEDAALQTAAGADTA